MRFQALFTLLLAGVASCTPVDPDSDSSKKPNLPACNNIYRPCKCPKGTIFKNFTSYGVIGAPAAQVQNIMGKFLNVTYQGGLNPIKTTGQEFKAGATRTFNLTAPGAPYYYIVKENLVAYENSPDGSFKQTNEQDPKEIPLHVPGSGTYYGEWGIIQGQQTLVPNETAVAWRNWRCEVGDTFPAQKSHEGGIANATAILQSQGLITGVNVKPFTIFYDYRQD